MPINYNLGMKHAYLKSLKIKRIILTCIVGMLMAGCDYTVPLVRMPEVAIDTDLIGKWERTAKGGEVESLLVLPLSKVEYLVVFPAGEKNEMFAKGCLWSNDSRTLIQLDWIGTAQPKLPENDRTFQYVSSSVEGNTLTLRLLNPDVVSKDIVSSEALAQAIADNKDNPKLFREEMIFQKVNN